MQRSAGTHLMRFLGGSCAVAGLVAWGAVAWQAISDLDALTPEGGVGGRLVVWGLIGTVLMIAGMVILHVAADGEEAEEQDERT